MPRFLKIFLFSIFLSLAGSFAYGAWQPGAQQNTMYNDSVQVLSVTAGNGNPSFTFRDAPPRVGDCEPGLGSYIDLADPLARYQFALVTSAQTREASIAALVKCDDSRHLKLELITVFP